MHYNLDINFAENLKEKNMLDQIFPASYYGYLYDIYENMWKYVKAYEIWKYVKIYGNDETRENVW